MKSILAFVLIFTVLANVILGSSLRGDRDIKNNNDKIKSKSKSEGKSNASENSNSATVVTSSASASKISNNIYKSDRAFAQNVNMPLTNFAGQMEKRKEQGKR
jgi:hypothetical protein